MEDTSTWSPEAHAFYEREKKAIEQAVALIIGIEPFYSAPTRIGDDIILGYLWSIDKLGVSQSVARVQLEERLKTTISLMRMRLFQCRDLTPDRIGVMLHVALALGANRVLEMAKVWAAMEAGDYDTAADELLLSEWPVALGFDDFCRRRIVSLANVLRHGERRSPGRPKGIGP